MERDSSTGIVFSWLFVLPLFSLLLATDGYSETCEEIIELAEYGIIGEADFSYGNNSTVNGNTIVNSGNSPTPDGNSVTVDLDFPAIDPLVFPPTGGSDLTPPSPPSVDEGSYGTIEFSAKNNASTLTYTGGDYYITELIAEKGATVQFAPGNYFIEDIQLDNQTNIIISPAGQVNIYIKNSFQTGNQSAINSTGATGNLIFYLYESASFQVGNSNQGNSGVDFNGILYTPYSATNIQFGNNNDIRGAILSAGTVSVGNNTDFDYSPSVQSEVIEALGCVETTGPDHIRIEHSGTGLTCRQSSITLRACADAGCTSESTDPVTVTMTPATASPPVWIGGDSYTFTGNHTVQLRQTVPGTLTLGLSNPVPAPGNPYRCYDSSVEGDCTLDFYDSGFIFNVPDLTSCRTSPTISLQAVRNDDTSQTCIGDNGFASTTKTVNFWSSYINPATGSEQLALNGTTIATSTPGSAVSLSFDATATATFTLSYPDAGQMQLNARYDGVGAEEAGLVILGSDSFITRPAGLCIYSDDANASCGSGDGSCSVFKKVDEPFTLKIKGVCWESSGDSDFCSGNPTTRNFQLSSIPITHTLIAPTGAGVSAGNIAVSTFSISATDNGEHSISNQSVSEVGVFTFTATPPNYFGTSLPSATSTNIGRFTPDHFITSVTNNGVFQDGCSGFTYSGQPFTYAPPDFPQLLITAKGSGGNTTLNYRDDFIKLTDPATQVTMPAITSDAGNLGADAITPLNITWTSVSSLSANHNGTLNFTLGADQFVYTKEANALVAPFNSGIQLSITSIIDSDGIIATDLPRIFSPAATEIRYGRMQLQNAYGPETLPLSIPLLTEYYTGTGFTLNGDDSCTQYFFSNLLLTNYLGNLTAGDTTPSGSGTIVSGLGNNLVLSTPGIGNNGTVDLEYDLDAAGLGWLKIGANNPKAKATFGIYKGNSNLIYMRESLW